MSKQEKLPRINQRPMGDTPSTVSTAGVYVGRTGTELGNWKVGPNSLSSGQVILCADGWIQVGDDSGTVRLDAQHPTYRLWAGADDPTIAPFTLDTAGNVRMQGEIDAASGSIAGWQIAPQSLSNADAILSSLGYLQLGTGDNIVRVDAQNATYRLWAGKADAATAPFRVTKAGVLTASGAVIQGDITALTGSLGDLSVSGTLELVSGGYIQSDTFSAGSSGWRISHDGDAEFNNIYARGRIDTAVFQYDQISAVSGSLLVTPSAGALGAAYTTAGALTIEGAAWAFATGDVVRIRAKDSAGAVKQAWVTVTRTGTPNVYTTVKQSGDDATWPVGTAVLGYGTGGGSLMMTAADALDGPRYSVNAHGASPWTDESEIGRFGLLDGWQTYVGTDYGIAIGDYSGGNYLLYGTMAGFELRAGAGNATIDSEGVTFGPQRGMPSAVKWLNAPGKLAAYLLAYDYPENGPGQRGGNALDIQAVGTSAADEPEGAVTIKAIAFGGEPSASLQLSSGRQGTLYPGECVAGLRGDAIALWTTNNAGPVHVHGTIRESVPIHMRLTRRTTQSIASGSWVNRYFDTVEYANAGSGIAGDDLLWMHTPLVFTGTGLDDLAHLGQPTYPDSTTTQFQVKITAIGTPDSFQYSMDNGATWNGTNIAITGASQTIGGTKDVRIQFGATTGHTLNDLWRWDELPRYRIVAKKAGLYEVVTSIYSPGASGTTLPYRIMLGIRKNDTDLENAHSVVQAQGEQHIYITVPGLIWLAVNDYIDCPVYQDSGVAKTLAAVDAANQYRNQVTITRIA